MVIGKKTAITILSIFIILVIVEANFLEIAQVLLGIRILFFILTAIPALLGFISLFSQKFKQSKWFEYLSDHILSYYAVIIVLISINTDIISLTTKWNTSLTGLGVGLFALGWALRKKPQTTETLAVLNKKLRKAEKVIDAFLGESQKLGKKLTAIQEEEGRGRRQANPPRGRSTRQSRATRRRTR